VNTRKPIFKKNINHNEFVVKILKEAISEKKTVGRPRQQYLKANSDVLMTVHLSLFISVFNQLDAKKFVSQLVLFHASTCFEHTCSSSGGQNCITQPLVSSHL